MAKHTQSPLLGYNNNVRHRNRVFHIQTEDSGVRHPHIITHLFMDGGRILKSVKLSYAEHVGMPNMADIVRGMMKEQHKAMFIALRDGQFDDVVEPHGPNTTRDGSPSRALPLRPEELRAREAQAEAKLAARVESAPKTQASASSPKPPAAAPPPAAVAAPVPASEPPPPPAAPKAQRLVIVPDADDGPASPPQPDGGAPKLELDLGAIAARAAQATVPDDRAAPFRQSDAPPAHRPSHPVQTPPGAKRPLVRPITTEARAPTRPSEPKVQAPAPRPETKPETQPEARTAPSASGPAPRPAPTGGRTPGAGRYAPARPASIFGLGKREVHVADKSLDEVILSYLAQDLEEPPPKR